MKTRLALAVRPAGRRQRAHACHRPRHPRAHLRDRRTAPAELMIEQRLRDKERSGELARIEQDARPWHRGGQSPAVAGVQTTANAAHLLLRPHLHAGPQHPRRPGRAACSPRAPRPIRWTWCRCRGTCCSSTPATAARSAGTRADGALPGKVKPILTGGSYLDLMKSWRIPVYYDQQGLLTRRSASPRCRPSSRRRASGCASTKWRCRDEAPPAPFTCWRPACSPGWLLRCSNSASAAGAATCTGKFPNPITDICWSCILPLSIGSAAHRQLRRSGRHRQPRAARCAPAA
jgi:hypothetical protein